MSSMGWEKIRLEAMRLPELERAELANDLVKILDAPSDSEAKEAWEIELAQRLAEVEVGTAVLIDREELRNRMRARMNGR